MKALSVRTEGPPYEDGLFELDWFCGAVATETVTDVDNLGDNSMLAQAGDILDNEQPG